MKIRITKRSIKKYQVGGEPKLEDYPDYGSYMSAYNNWLSTGAVSPAMNAKPDPQQAVTSAPGTPMVQSSTPGILPKNIGPVFQLNGNQQPNYAWTNFGQAPTVPMPKRTVVQPDGTKVTTGDFGTPTTVYAVGNNQGTPVTNSPAIVPIKRLRNGKIVPINTPPKNKKNLSYELAQAVGMLHSGYRHFDNMAKMRKADIFGREAAFSAYGAAPKFRGNFTINEGLLRPDDRTVTEGMFSNQFLPQQNAMMMSAFGGVINPESMRIIIKKTPQNMAYGGQSGWGLDVGQRKVYTDMQDTPAETYTNTMSEEENPDQPYVLETEGGEEVLRPDGTKFRLVGPSHANGGIKNTAEQVPEGSFVFSKKLKEKRPEILAEFGVKYKKGGVSYSDISKKYKLNEYKAMLEDKNAPEDFKQTAALMMEKNLAKLNKLKMYHEEKKGFPGGMPMPTMPSIGPNAEMGGYMKFQGNKGISQVPRLIDIKTVLGDWSDDYQALEEKLLAKDNADLRDYMFGNFLKKFPKSELAKDPKGQEKFVQNFLEAQKQFMALKEKYKNNPNALLDNEWDKNNDRYNREAKELGFTPLSKDELKRFQAGFYDFGEALKDPKFHERFGKRFKIAAPGPKDTDSDDLSGLWISRVDGIAGNNTIRELASLRDMEEEPIYDIPEGDIPKEKPKPKWICINDTVIQTNSGIGYDSEEEAKANCGKKQGEIPFDYTDADKMNMAWRASRMVPNVYLPELYTLQRRSTPLALDDWFARVQNRQSTYNTAMDTARKTNQSQAVGSFLAGLVGAQDVNDIADVNSRNLDRVDRRDLVNMEMDYKTDMFNLGQRQEYMKGLDILGQQYDNALDQGVSKYIQARGNADVRRGRMYEQNSLAKNFYIDPNNLKLKFKGATSDIFTNPAFSVGTNGAGGIENLGAMYDQYYETFLKGIKSGTEEERKKRADMLAQRALFGSRGMNSQSFDAYGMPKGSSTRSAFYSYPGYEDDDQ